MQHYLHANIRSTSSGYATFCILLLVNYLSLVRAVCQAVWMDSYTTCSTHSCLYGCTMLMLINKKNKYVVNSNLVLKPHVNKDLCMRA